MKEKAETLKKDIEYLFSKINWGDSFLDADAIRIMNEIGKRIDELVTDEQTVNS